MPKKKAKLKSESVTYSYPRVYSIVLWNTGEEDHGSTFGVLRQLLWEEIARINSGEADESSLKSLMIILDQMDEEFEKGRD
jgi:hypothetical protein